ncbi:MAG: DeoR/GlpR family DNA-binding transcription regulator [Methylobacteriaceae bacterium]|jgi:DeoR family glycerol-3-phosphate regulon repressor|nr:DeoR/GlpR family DNA-binding transcription regulator [Methylobacteriaceae bacterium]
MTTEQTSNDLQHGEERRNQIDQWVRQKGFVTIDTLARFFGVTVQTIRRDLNQLDSEGKLIRYRGGAGALSSVENIDYNTRQITFFDEKERIAQLVVQHIPEHCSICLNIGTTTEAVARALIHHKGLRVITNNANIATILAQNTDFDIIITGGRIRNRDGGVLGPTSHAMIEQFRVDFGIIGISGIDEDGTLLDFDTDEVWAAQAIIHSSRKTFLVTDHSKFSRRPMVRMGSIGDIHALFTDAQPPDSVVAVLKEHGVQLFLAE